MTPSPYIPPLKECGRIFDQPNYIGRYATFYDGDKKGDWGLKNGWSFVAKSVKVREDQGCVLTLFDYYGRATVHREDGQFIGGVRK